ncbi:FtsX-like permease family protein [Acinetobacter puyangensis]|uniref:Putative ABC transport system permease protein n=1 Tax=Acinetobacter puyangensis TaxID=1096779 RepID=A0A240EAF2_9GAMM|nr:FtsX-like permease family protein [Acinetobacter puyangensis]SNX44895.1 putative ABC transport system permease protein [Acinetobacter puyangensis]
MFRLFSSLFRQSLHSGGITLLIVSLSLAISATTALKFSNQQIQYAIEQQAGELLAADLVLSSSQPIEPIWLDRARETQLQTSQNYVFSSMAHTGEQFVMVNVKAIDDAFPLRGDLKIAPEAKQIQSGQIWLTPRVFDLLKVKIGDRVYIADAEFKVTGEIEHDANQEMGLSGFSPTVIIHLQDVAKTNAIQIGSRIDYRVLMSGAPNQLKAFEQHYTQYVQEPLKLRSASDSNSRLMGPIRNLETYMQLANLLTLLLCGIAIALTSQRYVAQNQDHIAMLRCLGASRKQLLGAFVALLAVVALLATLLGSIFGVIFGFALLKLMLTTIPHISLQFSLWAIVLGPLPNAVFTCLIVLAGFVLPSILHLAKVPPIRVLRQSQFDQVAIWIVIASALLSLSLFTLYLTENIGLTLSVIAAIFVLCFVLFAVVWLILTTLRKMHFRFEQWVREPAKVSLQMTALALGLSLISVLFLLRSDMFERWQQQLPAGTPNQFVYGLPPFDKAPFEQALAERQWQSTTLYPNIRGRLITKNGEAFNEQIVKENNSLKRELNLTQSAAFPQDNRIVAGTKDFTATHQVSVEKDTADSLGIQLGDQLGFELPDGNIEAKVVSFRTVEWESFSPNFFFIFSPQTLDENAGSYLGSFYLPPQHNQQMAELINQFPTTVFIDIDGIIEQIKQLVKVIAQIISILAFLVFAAGVLVLLACLNLLMDERKHEVALLRAIGMSQAQLKRYLSIELACIGAGAGVLAIAFAETVSYIVSWKMEIPWTLHWQYWLILPLLMAMICGVIGRYRLQKLWQIAPLLSLRNIG